MRSHPPDSIKFRFPGGGGEAVGRFAILVFAALCVAALIAFILVFGH